VSKTAAISGEYLPPVEPENAGQTHLNIRSLDLCVRGVYGLGMKHLVDRVTPVSAIHALNAGLIVVLMIGVPAVTGIELGSLRISSNRWLQRLLLAGLGLGVGLNLAMGWWCRPRRQRAAYRGWTLLHAAMLTVAMLTYSGRIHFDWLRDFLNQARRVRVISTTETTPLRPALAACCSGRHRTGMPAHPDPGNSHFDPTVG